MKLKLIVLILIFCMVSIPGASISPKNLIFQVEYTKPIAKVQGLDVIFHVKATPQQAETILKSQMEIAIKFFPPTDEILGTVWYAPDGINGTEKMIPFTNGKKHIVYSPKTKLFSYM